MISHSSLRSGVSRLVLEARSGWTTFGRAARLACGAGDYDGYLAHVRRTHPNETPLSYEAFFRVRQDARYGAGAVRCC